jgi:pimeloyl-ACP methyl ester carboxylesterase
MSGGGPAKIFADNYTELISGGKKELFGVAFGIDFYIDTISNAPIYTIKDIKCPVLFLQGLKDNPYRCADAKMAYDIMKEKGLSATYIELPDGNHGLDNVSDEAIGHTFNWISSVV